MAAPSRTAELTGLELTTVFEDEALRVESVAGEGSQGVVAFTGIGFGVGALQRAEFVSTASGGGVRPALFVTDKNKTWFNAPGLYERAVDVIRAHFAHAGVTDVVALGNSMGGFGACLFAGAIGATKCIAFSPQWAVKPSLMPKETRWQEHIAAIAEHRFETAFDRMSESTRYWLCSGILGVDIEHVRKFPGRPNVTHALIPGHEHNLTHYLKKLGLLTPLISGLLTDDREAVRDVLHRVGAFVQNEQGFLP